MRHTVSRVALSVDTAVLVALALVVAVPAFAQDVKVKYNQDYNFGEVRTYAWGTLDERAANTLVHEQILASLRKRLAEAHVREVGGGDGPDVLITSPG